MGCSASGEARLTGAVYRQLVFGACFQLSYLERGLIVNNSVWEGLSIFFIFLNMYNTEAGVTFRDDTSKMSS